jgi:hypothetical protein
MRRDSRGLRDYLREIADFDDRGFAEATGGTDRVELMELLGRLDSLLAGVDDVIDRGMDKMV